MKIELDDAPIVERDSWVGRIIEFSGAKTWCSLLVRGTIILSFVVLYISGLVHFLTEGIQNDRNFFEFIWAMYTVIGSILVAIGTIYLSAITIGEFNCWAQNRCTPIFKDDND